MKKKHWLQIGMLVMLLACLFALNSAVAEECEHTPEYARVAIDATYSKPYGTSHYAEGIFSEGYRCTKCGEVTGVFGSEYTSSGYVYHYIIDGVCVDCGYVQTCDHASLESCIRVLDATYGEIRGFQHYVTGKEYSGLYCWDCGEWASEPERISEEWSGWVNHRLVNGVCECGYDNPCAHEAEGRDYMVDAVYSDVLGAQHYVDGTRMSADFCKKCGEMTSEARMVNEHEVGWTDHIFVDGKCECGYEKHCEHSSEYLQVVLDAVYGETVGWQHYAEGTYVVADFCNQCGEMLREPNQREENWSGWISHRYVNGVCDCGYVRSECEHSRYDNCNIVPDGVYTEVYAMEHKVTGTRVWGMRCHDCGEVLTVESEEEAGWTGVDGHFFVNGVCDCGYVQTDCEHSAEYRYVLKDATYTDVYGRYHYGTGTYYSANFCTKCNEQMYAAPYGVYEDYTACVEHFFIDGVCDCGYTSECAHEKIFWDRYLLSGQYTDFYGRSHMCSGTMVYGQICLDCGEVCDRPSGAETFIGELNHVLINGVCACGYQSECAHNYSVSGYYFTDGQYTEVYGGEHVASGHMYYGEICKACGEVLYQPSDYGVVENRACGHIFINGVCACGYENKCGHYDMYCGNYFEDAEYGSVYGMVHSATGRLLNGGICRLCGETLSKPSVLKENTTDIADHVFINGVCACGYAKTCSHYDEYVPTITGSHYTKIYAQQHTYVEEERRDYTCAYCQEVTRPAEYAERKYQQDHTFVDGKCACGYVQTDCTHEHRNSRYLMTEGTFTQVYGLQHTGIGTRENVYYCLDCTEILYSNGYTWDFNNESEDHLFVNGTCICGYQNACEHEEERVYIAENAVYGAIYGEYHFLTGTRLDVAMCKKCGEQLKPPYGREENFSDYVKHYFVDGVCACGYEKSDCTHEHYSWRHIFEDAEYTKVYGEEHYGTGARRYFRWCEDCGEILSDAGDYEPEYSGWDEHFFVDGVCACGYEKHCDHTDYDWRYVVPEGEFSDPYGKVHYVTGERFYATVCKTCGEILKDQGNHEPDFSGWDNHYFVDGVCACGYKYHCDHSVPGWRGVLVDAEYESSYGKVHTGTGKVMDALQCEKCGEQTEAPIMHEGIETREEDHFFVNGVCACGYRFHCDHDRYEEVSGFMLLNAEYTASYGQTHYGTGDYAHAYVCTGCGEVKSAGIWETNVTRGVDHMFINGVCVCGYVKGDCEHVTGASRQESINVVYTMVLGDYHEVEYVIASLNNCEVCGELMDCRPLTGKNVGMYQHEFVDGVCKCGYVFHCDHETENRMAMIEPEYLAIYGNTHMVEGYVQHNLYCTKCGELCFTWTNSERSTSSEEHKFVDGVCACGYENTCNHADYNWYYTEHIDVEAYQSTNDAYHTCTGTKYDWHVCSNCGIQMGEAVEKPNYSGRAPHEYVDGVCGCGHVQTCDHSKYDRVQHYGLWNATYTEVYGKVHYGTGQRGSFEFCAGCGALLGNDPYEESYTGSDAHMFVNGVCECGYVYHCDHRSERGEYVIKDKQYTVDQDTHTVTGVNWWVLHCRACDELVNQWIVDEDYSETAGHYFRWDTCDNCECGFENPCDHPKADREVREYYSFQKDYIPVDYYTHQATATFCHYVECESCGITLGPKYGSYEIPDQTEITYHWYDDNGICRNCKMENPCEHPENMRYTYMSRDEDSYTDIVPYDNVYHQRTCVERVCFDCRACGMTIKTDDTTERTLFDQHWFGLEEDYAYCEECDYWMEFIPPQPTSIEFEGPDSIVIDLAESNTYPINIKVLPENARSTVCHNDGGEFGVDTVYKFSYSNANLLEYSLWGGSLYVNNYKTGTTTVTVTTANGKKDSIKVTVINSNPVTGVNIDLPDTITVGVGETLEVPYSLQPAGANMYTEMYVYGDDGYDGYEILGHVRGNIFHGKKVGTAKICVETDNGKKDYVTVKVVDPDSALSISLDKTGTVPLGVGETLQLNAQIIPATAEPEITWTCDESIVTVDENGLVTAVGEGTATVKAALPNGKYATVQIQVTDPKTPYAVIIDAPVNEISLEDFIVLSTTVLPETAETELTFTASDPALVDITEDGIVYPKAAGNVTITVTTTNGKSASFDLTIYDPTVATDVQLADSGTITLDMGQTHTLPVNITPVSAAEHAQLTWTSNAADIISVDENGVLTLHKEGVATITVSLPNGKSDSVNVRVNNPFKPLSISIVPPEFKALTVGESYQLEVEMEPSTAIADLTWTTSAHMMCSVDENGLLTAKRNGAVVITVKTENGRSDQIVIRCCDHATIEEHTEVVDVTYECENDTMHRVTEITRNVRKCIHCNTVFEAAEENNRPYVYGGYHDFTQLGGDECICGYVFTGCDHPLDYDDVFFYEQCGESYSIPKNSKYHETHYDGYKKILRCDDCGNFLGEKYGSIFSDHYMELGEHRFEHGMCVICGYENPCSHAGTLRYGYEYVDEENISINPVYREVICTRVTSVECTKCDDTVSEKREEGFIRQVTHDYMPNGHCEYCPAVLPDERIAPETMTLNVPDTVTMDINDTLYLAPVFDNPDAYTKLTWKNSNSDVADCWTGTIHPNKTGTVTITVTTANGLSDKVTIKIVDMSKPTSVTLDVASALTMNLNDTLQLNASLAPDTAMTALKWKSSDKTIVSVQDGLITALKEGTATITVTTSNSKTDTVKVTVVDPKKPTSVVLDHEGTVRLPLDGTLTLLAQMQPDTAESALTWTSSATSIATVQDGVVTPVKEGTATITVKTRNGKADTVKVTVFDPTKATSVTLDQATTVTINMFEDPLQLNATMQPETATSTLTWKSSNSKVASVDANGLVTAVGEGTATITVTTSTKKIDTVKVMVADPYKPSSVTLNAEGTVELILFDEELQLEAAIPEGSISGFTWSSSSKKIATVDENGLVVPVGAGTATITVKTRNGKTDTVKVKVLDPYKPASVTLNAEGTVELIIFDEELQLEAAIPEGSISGFTWTTSSTKIATVDENGLVIPTGAGTATITVKTRNGKTDTVKVKILDPYKPASVTLDQSGAVPCYMDGSLQLSASIPEGSISGFTWSSSNTKIVTVDENGLVTPVKEGTATITVKTRNGKTDTVKVTAADPLKAFKVELAETGTVVCDLKGTLQLNQTVTPDTSLSTIAWSSSNKAIATVDANGLVTGLKEGTVTITVKTSNGKTDTVKVLVADPLKARSIALNEEGTKTITLYDEELQLEAVMLPDTAVNTISWATSDKKIATVDANGLVVPVGAGTATITVKTSNGKTDTVKVKVLDPYKPSSVTLNASGTVELTLFDEELQLEAAIPEGSISGFTWSSSSKKIATVDENGLVIPTGAGTATITVKTRNGKTDTVKVKVLDPYKPSSVTLNAEGTVELTIFDEELQLEAAIPEGSISGFTWSSSSKKIATVDENGLVIPTGAGTATITVKTRNGKTDTVKVKVLDPYKPASVTLAETGTVKVNLGETLQLNASIPEGSISDLKWTSSAGSIAAVDGNGMVSGVKAGTATITVKTRNGKIDTVKVQVVDPTKATAVVLDQEGTVQLPLNSQLQLGTTLTPDTAVSALKWSTSDKTIAKVADGLVTPLKKGTVTITVTTDTGKKDTVKITVVAAVELPAPVIEPPPANDPAEIPTTEPAEIPESDPAEIPAEEIPAMMDVPAGESEAPAAETGDIPQTPAAEPETAPEEAPEQPQIPAEEAAAGAEE